MGDDRRGRVAGARIDHNLLLVAGEHFDSAGKRWLGQGMRVHADEQRAGNTLRLTELTDSLRDRQNMSLVKAISEG